MTATDCALGRGGIPLDCADANCKARTGGSKGVECRPYVRPVADPISARVQEVETTGEVL